jgi:hypothetical protein
MQRNTESTSGPPRSGQLEHAHADASRTDRRSQHSRLRPALGRADRVVFRGNRVPADKTPNHPSDLTLSLSNTRQLGSAKPRRPQASSRSTARLRARGVSGSRPFAIAIATAVCCARTSSASGSAADVTSSAPVATI